MSDDKPEVIAYNALRVYYGWLCPSCGGWNETKAVNAKPKPFGDGERIAGVWQTPDKPVECHCGMKYILKRDDDIKLMDVPEDGPPFDIEFEADFDLDDDDDELPPD